MIARLTWGLVTVALALPVGLYALEHRVQGLEAEVEHYGGLLLDEQQAAHVLRAEWARFNEPRRLQELTLRYEEMLQLAPITPAQVARVDELPLRLPRVPETAGEGPVPVVPVPASKPLQPAAYTRAADR